MKNKSLGKLKGVWDKKGGAPFKSDRQLKEWRESLWKSTDKRLSKRKILIP